MSAMDDGAKWMFIQANKSKAAAIVRRKGLKSPKILPLHTFRPLSVPRIHRVQSLTI